LHGSSLLGLADGALAARCVQDVLPDRTVATGFSRTAADGPV